MDDFANLQAVHSRSTLRFLRNTLTNVFAKMLVGNESQTQKNALRAATRFYKNADLRLLLCLKKIHRDQRFVSMNQRSHVNVTDKCSA